VGDVRVLGLSFFPVLRRSDYTLIPEEPAIDKYWLTCLIPIFDIGFRYFTPQGWKVFYQRFMVNANN
jgi:hypothetical protein